MIEVTLRAFIQTPKDRPGSINFAAAHLGFYEMGIECVQFTEADELAAASRTDVVVGGVGTVRGRLRSLGIVENEIDYPSELIAYLGRRIWPSTMNTVAGSPDGWPVFVKPVLDKKFTGRVIRSTADLNGCGFSGEDTDVLCSEVVEFVSEWRCFVRYGRILDVRPYGGSWKVAPSSTIIEAAIDDYVSAPAGYAADFGVASDGRTLLVEVNDGYALGSYGLQHNLYAQLLAARWSELVGVPDELATLGAF